MEINGLADVIKKEKEEENDIIDVVQKMADKRIATGSRLYKPADIDESFTTGRPGGDCGGVEQSFSKSSATIFGLENNRYYCYLNAVLQCLFAIKQFKDYYGAGNYKVIKIGEPMIRGLKFTKSLETFALNINKIVSS